MSLLLFSTSREDIKVWNKAIITSTDIAEKIVDIITTAITSIPFTYFIVGCIITKAISYPAGICTYCKKIFENVRGESRNLDNIIIL